MIDDFEHNAHAVAAIMPSSELILRRLLWLAYGCLTLYGDDGEMQCSDCHIDFLRDSAEKIQEKIIARNIQRINYITAQQSNLSFNDIQAKETHG